MSAFLVLQSALTPYGVIGLFSVIVFLTIYAVRKKFGPQWDRLASYIPVLNFNETPYMAIVSKLVQALPGTLLAAGLGAVTSGASLGPTLLSALAGLLASAGHEFLKWLPVVPYKGATNEPALPDIPKSPKVPAMLTGAMMVLVALTVSCATLPKDPCTAADKAAIQAQYTAEMLEKCSQYSSRAECPYADDVKAERAKKEERCR